MFNPNLYQEVTQFHAHICSGLADARRIMILYALSEQPRCVGELALELGMSQPTTSRHLNILRERNMVIARREGQTVIYSLADGRIIQALDLLRAVLADQLRNQAVFAKSVLDS